MARPTKAKAIERLQKALDAIPDLKQRPHDSLAFPKWHRDTEIAITNTFGQSRHIIDFKNVSYGEHFFELGDRRRYYSGGLDEATAVLQSMIDEIEEYWPEKTRRQQLLRSARLDRSARIKSSSFTGGTMGLKRP